MDYFNVNGGKSTMLNTLKSYSPSWILRGNFGLEREMLRCNSRGELARTPHPRVFGEKLCHPYITTDFSESQIELVTPVFPTPQEAHTFLHLLYNIVAEEIGDELLWGQSMPCALPPEQEIPLASFCDCADGKEARAYREQLFAKYGGIQQLISGVHYNFSFDAAWVDVLYAAHGNGQDRQAFQDALYLKMVRRYLTDRWLFVYLFGSASAVHESFKEACVSRLTRVGKESYSNEGALSYRNSVCGYRNHEELFPDYSTVDAYSARIREWIKDGEIASEKELYAHVRLKGSDHTLHSLETSGIHHIEIRSIDLNPFDPAGVANIDLEFLQLYLLMAVVTEEEQWGTDEEWQKEAAHNQMMIALFGGKEGFEVLYNGESLQKSVRAAQIFAKIETINRALGLGKEQVIRSMQQRMDDVRTTYGAEIQKRVQKTGYIATHVELAQKAKAEAHAKRYQLIGYGDLELSTQLLMKEAIKQGIVVEVMDRGENFIALTQDKHTEYIKQATKTSADSYASVLMMENKTITKMILHAKGIAVPLGVEVKTIEDCVDLDYTKPIVVKPKSTNFGLGISIFPEGTNADDFLTAFQLAKRHDAAVLIEPFVQGKEYRFLVIGNEVVAVLHRVPANVVGDGKSTIEALVANKNTDPLRGRGYVTPLEKIQLDDEAQLFLASQHRTAQSIPAKGEVVMLRENSNISTGGDSIDWTDAMPEAFKAIAVSAAQSVGAKICGVDMMIADTSDEHSDYSIIELNFNPAIHIHSFPYEGEERNIAIAILQLLQFDLNDRT
ncbi:MAG: bifunctional glutamate--cysteine ligase GshA/glutathione synthetase GshB [Bacilli bacterium]